MNSFEYFATILCCQLLIQYPSDTETNQYSDGADIAFIIDSSGSWGRINFHKIKPFVKDVMTKLVQYSTNIDAAVVLFSTNARVMLNLSQKFNLQRFMYTIDGLPFERGYTMTDRALLTTAKSVFSSNSRQHVPKIAILITDGPISKVQNPVPAKNASEPLKQKGVRIFVVGVGRGVVLQELLDIAEREKDIILPKGVSQLRGFVDDLVPKVLSAIDNPSIRLDEDVGWLFVGRKTFLRCVASGWPLPEVKWFMNGKELRNDVLNQNVVLEEETQQQLFSLSLHFSEVDTKHVGNFTCEAKNKYHTKRRNIQVSLTCPPESFTLTALRPRFLSSEIATLRCEIEGLDHRNLELYHWQWKFQEREIKENIKYKVFYEYLPPNLCQQSNGWVILQISNISNEDWGQYMCVLQLSNMTVVEKDISLYELANPKVPTPPAIETTQAVKCGRAIKVKWIPPATAESLSSPITGYEINFKSHNDDSYHIFNLSGEVRFHEFVGLKTNAVYEINIRAKNSHGLSLSATEQLTTTADVPKAFMAQAVPLGCSAKLSWNTPSFNSCPIARYTIHYRESMSTGGQPSEWQMTALNEPNITGYRLWLNCSKRYDVMTLAWNERGHNDYSEKSVRSVLTDTGVPFEPLLTDVKRKQCGTFEVIWKSSALDSGGGPVTGFQAQTRKKGDDWRNCTNFPTNQSCLFKYDLSETDYDIRVQAFNQKGSSKWTIETVTTDEIGPPDPPFILNNQSELTGRNVTVTWTRPLHKDCNITMYSIHYRAIEPITEKLIDMNITDKSATSYELHLQYSKKYKTVVFAWNNLGRSAESNEWHVRTAQDVPYQPILHQAILGECNSINITWSLPALQALGDPVTNYLAQLRTAGSEEPWLHCTSFNKSYLTSCLFTHLTKYTEYEVRVLAKNKLGYGLPSDILKISTKGADHPGRPEIVERKVSGCNVTLKWTAPLPNDCPIRYFTVIYRQKELTHRVRNWTVINITEPAVKEQELSLNCSTTYEFKVRAWNELGGSFHSTVQSATMESATKQDNAESLSPSDSSIVNTTIIAVLLVVFFVMAIVLLVIAVRHFRRRAKHMPKRTINDIQVLERCQIHPIRTEFVEELGEGAFGKVHKATLKDGFEFFKGNAGFAGKTKQKITVAVKELHENATEDQRREFLDEIELMNKVGKHQNVLSFLGCWTTTKPLLLIIEYVAHGDLLHWLRRKRSQIKSSAVDVEDKKLYAGSRKHIAIPVDQAGDKDKGNKELQEENLRNSSAHYRREGSDIDVCTTPLVLFPASAPERDGTPAETKADECSGSCELFYQADLMSFVWQIARGMTFLSEKGFVHRDLAARNVLVGHGKLLKIADFGLMRQLYHEVYEVQKQKKLPVKWMAPESLYKQIFTSKSDVWSYGVVMWEIATVGGTPYPLLGNAELMRRLKAGYRMEKPDLCSDNFYAMMLDCWKQDRDERPSFQELLERLEEMMLQEVEYFDFNKVDESKDYYHVQESKTEDNEDEENVCHQYYNNSTHDTHL